MFEQNNKGKIKCIFCKKNFNQQELLLEYQTHCKDCISYAIKKYSV